MGARQSKLSNGDARLNLEPQHFWAAFRTLSNGEARRQKIVQDRARCGRRSKVRAAGEIRRAELALKACQNIDETSRLRHRRSDSLQRIKWQRPRSCLPGLAGPEKRQKKIHPESGLKRLKNASRPPPCSLRPLSRRPRRPDAKIREGTGELAFAKRATFASQCGGRDFAFFRKRFAAYICRGNRIARRAAPKNTSRGTLVLR